MSARPPVFVGDFVRAVDVLKAGPEVRSAIAELLGVAAWAGNAASPAEGGTATAPAGDEIEREGRDLRRGAAGSGTPQSRPRRAEPDDPGAEAQTPVRSSLQALPGSRSVPPLWRSTAAELPAPTPEQLQRHPPEPLLLPRWTPGVVDLVASTRDASGPIDAVRIVDDLARGRVPARLPRRERATLSRGAQVLLDVGPTLLPFAYDVAGIAGAIERVLGGAPLEILRFAGLPSWDAGPGPRKTWSAYPVPRRPRPVLLISDLGVRRPPDQDESASAGEWLSFVETLERAGCPAIALIPYPVERVPPLLARRLTLVRWDRTTSVVTVRRLLARAPRVAG